MVGSNCALFGCPTSRTREFAIFKIHVVGAADGEEIAAKKRSRRIASNYFKDSGKDSRSLETNLWE